MCSSQLVEKLCFLPAKQAFLINFSDDMCVGKITSIRTTVRVDGISVNECASCALSADVSAAAWMPQSRSQKAARMPPFGFDKENCPNGTFSTVSEEHALLFLFYGFASMGCICLPSMAASMVSGIFEKSAIMEKGFPILSS